jgi:hypothetical protein
MSTASWVRSQRDRPTGDGERRVALTLVAVVATLLLAVTVLGAPAPDGSPQLRDGAHTEPPTPASAPLVSPAAEERAAREFLDGYVGYIYGHGSAGQVRGATPAFEHALLASPPRVPPSMRARHPRVVALHLVNAPAGLLGVTAIINDGGLVDYPIALFLADRGQRLRVNGLAGA